MKKPVLLGILIIAILAVVGIVAYILLSNNNNTQLASPTNSDGNAEVVDYALDLESYSFSPDQITAEPGETLKIKLTSIDASHDFFIDELGIKETINSGKSKVIEVKIPESAAGKTYTFYCSMPGHKDFGMTGTLSVIDNK